MFTRKYERKRRRDEPKDKAPEDMLFEILVRLPVKSILRFRCVCKSWNALITSPIFINAHLKRNMMKSACDYVLIHTSKKNCLSVFNAETFAKCLDLELPKYNGLLPRSTFSFAVYGSCNGLVCISDSSKVSLMSPIYLWNPSIRKIKRLPKSIIHLKFKTHFTTLGFGFQCGGNDYKVVKVVRYKRSQCLYEVEVYSLRLHSWRRISAVPSVSHDVHLFTSCWGYSNGVVYWISRELSKDRTFILSFDLGSEVFQKIMLPDTLARPCHLTIQVYEKSLSFVDQRFYRDENNWRYDIWVREMDTLKMIRTILLQPGAGIIARPLGFRTDGRVHIVRPSAYLIDPNLVLYDLESHQVKDNGIKLTHHDKYIDSYTESLVLLN